ncbi:helicase HerA domain-containing protein [Actinomadura sp. 1N219]|uniref:helicase HerA domain-containing protein n=1 Tax=Actinomadura sp. 1N219 TaxID=3375152 RepID=UPI0037975A82
MLHLASVQIDFIPGSTITGLGTWGPPEPLAWGGEVPSRETTLSHLGLKMPSFKQLRGKVEDELMEYQKGRLEQILSFVEKNAVDLCVFPEYAFLVNEATLNIFAGFAPKITIVAGLGMIRRNEVELLAKYTGDSVAPNSNIAVVFSGGDCHVVAKQHPAEDEVITAGSGIRCVPVTCGGRELNLGVAICKDYLAAGHNLGDIDPAPDILAIPALTGNTAAFQPEAPRDFPRIFANHARHGGSTIFAAGLNNDRFVERRVLRPLPAEAEGITAVEWHGPPHKVGQLRGKKNCVTIRSAMIARDDGPAVADIVRTFQGLARSTTANPETLNKFPRWLAHLDSNPRFALIADALRYYQESDTDDLVTPEEAEQLSTHFVSQQTVSLHGHWQRTLRQVSRKIDTEIGKNSQSSSHSKNNYNLLLGAAGAYATARTDNAAESAGPEGEGQGLELRRHFSLGLGTFQSNSALATLSDQQDLLLMFARSAPEGSRITFRLETRQDPATGNVSPRFYIDFYGPSDDKSVDYFTSVERIARSVYLRGWSTYTSRDPVVTGHTVDIVPGEGVFPRVREDLGFLVDVLRATGGGCALEISGLRQDGSLEKQPATAAAAAAVQQMSIATAVLNDDQAEPTVWFASQPVSAVGLGIHIRLTTPEPNEALANLVGAAVFSGEQFETIDRTAGPETLDAPVVPVEVAHRILHPPHGYIEGRGLGSRRPLSIPVTGFSVVGEGAVIGTAKAARPYVDDEIEIRIPDADRLLHTYVIGRTGVGKTNTLKNLARHDLSRPGPAVIIDPHGDLFDYAVRHATSRRSFLALDFAGEDVPSLNPIYLDAADEAGVNANIEQLIELVVNSMYFEWAGPRFTDLLRLCLQTLVAIADEEAGRWAYLGDVVRLIEDKRHRAATLRRLRQLKRDDLLGRWSLHSRMRDTEQAEVEQWFISKFGDFRVSEALVKATSGKPSANLEAALREGAAVLVKIPRTALGTGPSRFIGSLIVDRVLRYTMDGAFLASETPASLIVDEFQNFIGTSFATLIPEARKFNLGITVANQTISQLHNFSKHEGSYSDDISHTLLGNVGNLIVQGVGKRDAEQLSSDVGIPAEGLTRIQKHGAAVVLTVDGERLEPFTVKLGDSNERPGVVAGTVAAAQAQEALRKAKAAVSIPSISRVTGAEEGAESDDENGDSRDETIPPAKNTPSLDEWLDKRRKAKDPKAEDENSDDDDDDEQE